MSSPTDSSIKPLYSPKWEIWICPYWNEKWVCSFSLAGEWPRTGATWVFYMLDTRGGWHHFWHSAHHFSQRTTSFQGHCTMLFYTTVQVLCTRICSLITLALLDGPFSFSSLSSVSPLLLRSSALTLRSRWDTCQKATQPHRANSWARHTQFTVVEKHAWLGVCWESTAHWDRLHRVHVDRDALGLTLFTLLIGLLRSILHLASILVDLAAFRNLI